MSTEIQWFEFSLHLIKTYDIDYIELNHEDSKITLGYHVGLSYLELYENFTSYNSFIERKTEIKKILGAQ